MFVDLEFDYNEATSRMKNFCQDDIDELRNWIQKLDISKCVPKNLSDKQIVLFYNACYGDIEKTKQCIENYYECRRNTPELFEHRVWNADIRKTSEILEIFPLRSIEGYEVIYNRLHNSDPLNFELEQVCKMIFMTVDLCLFKRGPQSGYIFLLDMKGIKIGHITKMNLLTLRKLFQYVQRAVPVRMRAIHVLNTEPVMDNLMFLIKPFMDRDFYDIIKLHRKDEDMENIYKIFPRSSLPSDYGGTLADTQALTQQNTEQLKLLDSFFKFEEEQRIAALPDKGGNDTLVGTFKKLEID